TLVPRYPASGLGQPGSGAPGAVHSPDLHDHGASMARRRTKRSAEPETALVDDFNSVVRRAGGGPDELTGKLVREMLHTAVKLIADEADTGELKLISRSLKELRYALKVFRAFRHVPKVTIFGSARTPIGHPDYRAALAFSKAMAAVNWMVITGAGGGIMQA